MGLWFVLSFFAAILFSPMQRGHCASIIGGKESAPHSRPYMAALMKRNHSFCGGTLIQGNWVLTAAHCSTEKETTTVVLGAHSLSNNEKEKQFFQIINMVAHPKYNGRTNENDIKLLQLDRKAKITRAVKSIPMPKTYDDIKARTQCLVTGWGITENRGKPSDTLREVDVMVIDRHICKKLYNSKALVTPNMVCAGGTKKPRKDTCKGDSGGPLICEGIQRGITSFGLPGKCGDPKYPGVYTRLTKDYLEWIKKTIGRNLD
ncbi:granzyme A-like [Heteronotia binoei]|uniref:granzyme A-like n=1 Tax=Heteronotia binoei TaxID=13085 RepID=UPI002931C943|nr:granzyme A-like [Heteronotia binoei]